MFDIDEATLRAELTSHHYPQEQIEKMVSLQQETIKKIQISEELIANPHNLSTEERLTIAKKHNLDQNTIDLIANSTEDLIEKLLSDNYTEKQVIEILSQSNASKSTIETVLKKKKEIRKQIKAFENIVGKVNNLSKKEIILEAQSHKLPDALTQKLLSIKETGLMENVAHTGQQVIHKIEKKGFYNDISQGLLIGIPIGALLLYKKLT